MRAQAQIAFLLAAGRSRRFGAEKLFEKIGEKTVFERSLEFLESAPEIKKIIIAANRANRKKIAKIVEERGNKKIAGVILGGKNRFETVYKAIRYFRLTFSVPRSANFIIHNAANPMATREELSACFRALRREVSGAAVGRPASSTLKYAPGGKVERTISRTDVWEMETPQVVRADVFLQACEKLVRRKTPQGKITDDLFVLEAAGFSTRIVPASLHNRKITSREDMAMFRAFYEREKLAPLSSVGIGEDSHRFGARGSLLILGGVKIPKLPALEAQSDGDVVLHALCNAISSALGGGSLGTYADDMCRRGIRDSRKYLKKNLLALGRAKSKIQHCAIAIEAARPKIDPLVPAMKKSLSRLLNIPEQNISITATSGEKLTPFGKGQAIKCQAIVLLQSDPTQR